VDGDAVRQHRSVMTATTLGGGADAQLHIGVSLLVRRSNQLATTAGVNATALECTFPDLLPFGRGGPREQRETAVSFERCVRHYLRLSSRAFAQHATFVLVAKDLCGRAAMMTNVSVRVHLDAALASSLASLSRNDAAAALQAEQERRAAAQRGEHVPRVAGVAPAAAALMRQARATTGKLRGGDAERAVWGKRVWNMMLLFGVPVWFVTFAPNDAGDVVICVYVGSLVLRSLDRFDGVNLPTPTTRFTMAAKDPVAAARRFERLLAVYVREIIGFDAEHQRPLRDGGAFGVPSAYIAFVESQDRGALHAHILIWLLSLLTEEHLVVFASSICTVNMPLDLNVCPTCDASDTLVRNAECNVDLARSRVAQFHAEPQLARCTQCETASAPGDLIRAALQRLKEKHGVVVDVQRDVLDMPVPLSLPAASDARRRIILAELRLACNMHSHKHTSNCFKTADKKARCRYGFPLDVVDESSLDAEHRLQLQRLIGNNYVNKSNDIVLWCYRCNNDVRFIATTGSRDAMWYTIGYVSKAQSNGNTAADAMRAAVDMRYARNEVDAPRDEAHAARRLIGSAALGATSKESFSAPMCAFSLLGNDIALASHPFGSLLLAQFLALLRKDAITVRLDVDEEDNIVAVSQVADYMLRHESLADICLYEWVASYEKIKLDSRAEVLPFSASHPQHATHGLARRARRVLPDLIGPRLPSRESLTDVQSVKEATLYCQTALVLFKPFASFEGLAPMLQRLPAGGEVTSFATSWHLLIPSFLTGTRRRDRREAGAVALATCV
jgi:hypothetical protein